MASLRKNVASQNITFQLTNVTTGAPVTAGGAGNVSKDGGAQAACTGTFTHLGTGQWLYVPAQAETNATSVGFQFTGTGAININMQFFTDNWDTTQAVLTSGSGAAQIAVNGSGKVSGVVLTDTVTTYTGNTVQTGDAFARIGVAGVGLTNLGDTRIANLDAAVTTRMATYTQPTGFLAATFPAGTVANTTNITAGTITTATNLTNAPTAGDFTATMKTSIGTAVAASAVASVTGNVGGNVTGSVGSVIAAVTVDGASPLTEAYAAAGAGLTLAKAAYMLVQQMTNMTITGTTMTVRKRDGATAAYTNTLNDATTPTAITQAT